MKDYYDILGVSPSAHSSDIKGAYRRLAVQYHPDKNPDPSAEAMFKEINEAYDVLGDPEKKSLYDWKRQNPLSELVQEEQPPQHRDPRYRRKGAASQHKSDAQRMREFMQQYLVYGLWICRIGLVLTTALALDYILPYRNKTEVVVDQVYVHYQGRRSSYSYYLNITESGRQIKMDVPIAKGQVINYQLTVVYSTVMSVTINGNKQTLGKIYGAVVLFPAGVFITSLLGILFRKSTEFAFNASIVCAILLLISLYLIG